MRRERQRGRTSSNPPTPIQETRQQPNLETTPTEFINTRHDRFCGVVTFLEGGFVGGGGGDAEAAQFTHSRLVRRVEIGERKRGRRGGGKTHGSCKRIITTCTKLCAINNRLSILPPVEERTKDHCKSRGMERRKEVIRWSKRRKGALLRRSQSQNGGRS
jgi:hypothetical protein